MKNYFLCLLGLVVFSCGNDLDIATYKIVVADSIEERSAQKVELTGENFGPKGEFGHLRDISLVNATIIVQDQKRDYAFFGLKNEGSLIPFQEIGNGPDQVENSDFIKIVNYDESSNEIYFFNYSNKSLSSVRIQHSSVFQKIGDIPELYWGQVQSAVNLNDSLVAVTGLFPQTKFIVFNRNNQKEVARSEYVNSFDNELSEEGRVAVAPKDVKYNKKHDIVILTSANVNSIDTYSVDGKFDKSYSFGEMKNLSTENIFSRDYFYYYDVGTREDVIYGLYLGVEHKVIAMQDIFLSRTRPEFHVFNLLTDELLRFKLDRIVNACVFDVENNIVYCIDENNEDQPLVKYEIPEIH